MTKYLVLYRADHSAQQQMSEATPEQAQAGMAAWTEWQQRAGDAVVDMGSPLAPVDDGGDATIAGYSVLEAETPDALAALLDGHPHLQVGTLETHRFLDLPGM
jgi:hypothetical protein